MNSVTIKSCNDETALSLAILGRSDDETSFVASISGSPFIGEVTSSTYFAGPPTLLFREMAESWSGWKGEKTWAALEGELTLKATTTSLGQITLHVELVRNSGDFRLSAVIGLEAGQLEHLYREVNSVLPLSDR